jgi:hypothetical protein
LCQKDHWDWEWGWDAELTTTTFTNVPESSWLIDIMETPTNIRQCELWGIWIMEDCDNQGDMANESSGLSWEEKILMANE